MKIRIFVKKYSINELHISSILPWDRLNLWRKILDSNPLMTKSYNMVCKTNRTNKNMFDSDVINVIKFCNIF